MGATLGAGGGGDRGVRARPGALAELAGAVGAARADVGRDHDPRAAASRRAADSLRGPGGTMIGSRSAAVRLLLLAFSLGALVGGAATMVADRGAHRTNYDPGRQGYLERLDRELDLTDAQRREVAEVLERHEPVMDSLWRMVRAPFDSARQAVRRDIRATLSPEQVTKYDAMLARRDSAHR